MYKANRSAIAITREGIQVATFRLPERLEGTWPDSGGSPAERELSGFVNRLDAFLKTHTCPACGPEDKPWTRGFAPLRAEIKSISGPDGPSIEVDGGNCISVVMANLRKRGEL